MSDIEQEYIDLIKCYRSGDDQAFELIWQKSKNLVNFSRFIDPSGARSKDDFEAVAKVKCYLSLFGKNNVIWQPGKGSTVISWLRNCMIRSVLREIKHIKRNVNIKYIQHEKPGSHRCLEEILSDQITHDYTNRLEFDEDYQYKSYFEELSHRIKQESPNLQKAFELRVAFPNVKIKTIAKILGASHARVYQYLSALRKITKEVIYDLQDQ